MDDSSREEEAVRRVKEMERDEPLLQENPRRFVMFPIQYSDIWEFYKKAVGTCIRERFLAPEFGASFPRDYS